MLAYYTPHCFDPLFGISGLGQLSLHYILSKLFSDGHTVFCQITVLSFILLF